MAESDESLLALASDGDADALSALLERYGPQVRAELHIGRRWQPALSADDVMQTSYMEAFLRIGDFTPFGKGAFYRWLKQIAENNLRDAIKELERAKRPQLHRRIKAPPGDDSFAVLYDLLAGTTSTPSRRAARDETRQILESSLARLPKDYATVVRLYDLEGRPTSEVCASMGRTRGALYMLRARAHDQLRVILGSASKFFSDQP